MNKEQRQAELVIKAEEAEHQANKFLEPNARNAWAAIAANYRTLAEISEKETSTFKL